jgi:hypothetical protein
MCEQGRPPKMSIPAQATDEDILIAVTLEDAATLLAVVRDLADAEDCDFDHKGYCQAHSWLYTEPKCPHGRAKEILEGAKGENEQD